MIIKNQHNAVLETGNIIYVNDEKGSRCGRILRFFTHKGYKLAEIDVGETFFYFYREKWLVKSPICISVDRIYKSSRFSALVCLVGDCSSYSPDDAFQKV